MPIKFLAVLKSYERGIITEEEFCRLLDLPDEKFMPLMLALKAHREAGDNIPSFDFNRFWPLPVPERLKPSFYDEVE